MLSIIIADDESGIVALCKMLIEYPQATVIGEASNGLELLDKIGELHPNTVITDISMPGMTGLELIEQAQTEYPDVNFIIMSGYTDFEYVQKALRFGVWDYLLKPLKKSELNGILKKLDEHLTSQTNSNSLQKSMQSDLKESVDALRKSYLADVWNEKRVLPIPNVGDHPILDFQNMVIQAFSLCLDWRFSIFGMETPTLERQIDSFFQLILPSLASVPCLPVFYPFPSDGGNLSVLVLYSTEQAVAQSEFFQQKLGQALRTFNNQNNHARMSCGASLSVSGSPEALPVMFSQAISALRRRLDEQSSTMILYQTEIDIASQKVRPFTQEAALRHAVEICDEEQVLKCLQVDWSRCQNPIPGTSYHLMESQLRCINQALAALPDADKLWNSPQLRPTRILSGGGSTAVEFPARITDAVQRAFSEYRTFFRTQEHGVVSQAKQYVTQHYAEDITLNIVAQQVCLSPAYLSTLFKSETGCSFIKYLQKVRMDQAKKLLKTSKMRVSDIAEAVGYRDLKFFNKVFLSETTVTPSEYRKYYS